MDEALITFTNADFRFTSGSPIISNLTYSLQAGRRVGVVGVSGVGKTTLLRLVTGRLAPSAGAIRRAAAVDPARSGRFGLIAQGENLFPWRTVAENLELARHGMKPSSLQAWAAPAMAQLRLAPALLAAYPQGLSVGMRKRVEIMRALAAETIMLLADEPFAPLDQGTSAFAKVWIDDQLRPVQGAMLLVSHDLALIAEWCHEVLMFSKSEPGKISIAQNPVCGMEPDAPASREFRLEMANAIGAI